MREHVEILEVAPRDGLQNEPRPISTEEKLLLIDKLAAAGLTAIQATSFMNPKLVPQMADAESIAVVIRRYPNIKFSALIANEKGYMRAVAAGFRHLEFVSSASNTFSRRNVNRSLSESVQQIQQITRSAVCDGVELRIGISSAFHCPFEGRIPAAAVVKMAVAVREEQPWAIALSDTDGMAYPNQVWETVGAVIDEGDVPVSDIALHFHDTYGRALANTLAGLELGVRWFDSSVSGLGGCPFCPGASGNVATEDLAALLSGMGYDTAVDLEKLLDAAVIARQLTSRPYQGHLLRARRPQVLVAENTVGCKATA